MSSSDKTSEPARVIASSDVVRRGRLSRLLRVLLLFLALLIGAYAAITLRSYWRPASGQVPLAAKLERDFDGDAFGDEATVEAVCLEAQQAVEELIERHPDLVEPYYAKAHLYLLLDQTPEAAKAWRRCLDIDPLNTDVYVQLATCEMDEGRHAEAIRLLRQAMAFLEIKDQTSTKLLLRKIIKNYPKSNEAKIAQKKLKTLK